MDRKIMTKVLAAFLAFILTFANVALLGISANKSYGAEKNLEGQAKSVEKAEIEFDAYFEEEGEISHSKLLNVSEEKENLYLNIKVKEGYLTNASVRLQNANFRLQKINDDLNTIQSISEEENKIVLNQINKEESVVLNVPIKIDTGSNFDASDLDKIAIVKLEGTYVNSKGKEVEVSKEIEVKVAIDGEAKGNLTAEVLKYVSFNVNGNEGLILQTSIKSNLEGNILPVKSTKLEIEIPNINNIAPEVVTLSAKSLKATRGEEGKVFVKDKDYTYENGKITLELENNNENLSWVKNSEDEIILTSIYNKDAIIPKANMKINVKSDITYYGKELKTVTSQINETKELTNQIGDIVTGELKLSETTLYKGYMEEEKGKNTEFASELSLNIGYSELVDKIIFKDDTKYIDESGNTFTSNALYTYSKISKENLLEILGEDGYINVYNENGELITTLNKDNLEIKYDEEVKGITFETSKIVTEGILKLENGKAIKPLEYSKTQMENFTQIRTELNMNVIKDDSVIIRGTKSSNINLLKPETKANLSLNKTNLSTVITNKDVELRVTLNTTGADTVLYKNPEIEIVLPKYIKNIEAENAKLLYEKDLKFKDVKIEKNENGNLVIKIDLAGEQTEYNNLAASQGATILMNTDITVNEITPTKTDKVVLNVKNAKTGESITSENDVKFVAPYGIATVNQITGFNERGESATSISGNKEIGEIKTRAEAKTATINMIAINNYDVGCENIKILGRTPFEGNKGIKTGNDLGSTFTAKMISKIKTLGGISEENMTVYYSQNGNASKDLSNLNNGWTTDIYNLAEVKSFMIVLNNFVLRTGEILEFSYEIEVPEGLAYNEQTYGTFAVYYTKQSAEAKIARINIAYEESTEAGSIGLTTGIGPNLAVNLTANVEANSEVEERSNIKYTVKVKNNAELTAKDVNVKVKVPDRAFLINEGNIDINSKEINLKIAEIAKGREEEVTFTLRVPGYMKETLSGITSDNIHYYDENGNEISKEEINANFNTTLKRENFETDEEYEEYKKDLEKYLNEKEEQEIKIESVNKLDVKAEVTVEGYADSFESNTFTNKIISATTNPRIDMKLSSTPLGTIDVGINAQIFIDITKNIQENMTNVVMTCKLPEGLTYVSSEGESNYDENTRTVTWKYDKLEANTRTVLNVKVEDLPEGTYSKDYEIKLNATCNESNKTFTSEEFVLKTAKQGFNITQTSNISNGQLNAGEEITYAVTVKNLSSIGAKLTITDKLPSELEFVKYFYTQNGKTVEFRTSPVIPIDLEAGETLTIYITAKAKMMGQNVKITNKVELSSQLIEKLEAEDLTLTLLGVEGENPDVPENPDNPQVEKYRISGTAWLDANKNGKRDDGEELLPNIKAYLLNATNNNIISETITNENGNYTFLDINRGNYIVAFEYDLNKYELAEYQKSEVEEDKNSDVIKMTLKVNGKENTYAASNMITLNSDMYNLDLGLTNSTKFDLKLEKTVSLVQVSKNGKTKSYNFKNTDLAKVELPEKEIPGSIVAITYSIKVTNEGAVPGYANKIVDYKAKDLDFSSTLNPEWYQDVSGNIYNTTLSSRLIKPGETVEVQLILTKTMTSENTGLSNNTAEIAESSNDQGFTDVDSVPGNKNDKEDDYGRADVIITVKTGGIIFYGGIILIVLGIFALGAYEINKRVLRKI